MHLHIYETHRIGLHSDGRKWYVTDDYGNLMPVDHPTMYYFLNTCVDCT